MKRYSLNLRFAAMTALDPVVTPNGATLTSAGLVPGAAASPAIVLAPPWWNPAAFTLWGEFALGAPSFHSADGGEAAATTARLLALENAAGDHTLAAAIAAGEITVTDCESGATLRFPLPADGRFRLAISVTAATLSASVAGAMQTALCDNAHTSAASLLPGGDGLVIPHLAVLPRATSAALLPVLSELDDGAGSAPDANALLFGDGDPALWPDGDPMAWPSVAGSE
jgi:hypothetical protein